MISALVFTLQLLLAEGDHCYFVSNTRIEALPSCDIDPSTIDELTEDPAPVTASSLRQGALSAGRWSRSITRPTIVVRGNEELEGRLETAEQQRIDAVTQRVSAEMERDAAVRQRDAALRELATTQKELTALRARMAQLVRLWGAGDSAAGETNAPYHRADPGGHRAGPVKPPSEVASGGHTEASRR